MPSFVHSCKIISNLLNTKLFMNHHEKKINGFTPLLQYFCFITNKSTARFQIKYSNLEAMRLLHFYDNK